MFLIFIIIKCPCKLHVDPPRITLLYEPRHEKTNVFAYAKIKTQISLAVTAKLISAFVFATQIVQSLCTIRKPERWFSHDAAHIVYLGDH